MKTIRLLYPDYVSGGLETYYFGANLLQYILPENKNQPIVRVEIAPPDGRKKSVTRGILAEDEVLAGIKDAQEKLNFGTAGPRDYHWRQLHRFACTF